MSDYTEGLPFPSTDYRPPYDPLLNPNGEKPGLVVGRCEQLTNTPAPVRAPKTAAPTPSFYLRDDDPEEVLRVLATVLQHGGDCFVTDRASLERVGRCIVGLVNAARGDK